MRVAKLTIKNFRGIKEANLRLRRHNVFIGANNSGKTTVLEALALLFGRDRLVRSLTEHDFHGSNPTATDRIRLTATIWEFPGNDPSKNLDWFHPDRAVPVWIDRAAGRLVPEPVDDKSILACQIEFAARFNRTLLEVETARYFVDDESQDVFADDNYHSVPPRLLRELGFYFVAANRTWDRALSFGNELFRRVVTTGDGVPAQAVLSERNRLRSPQSPVEEDKQLAPIINSINTELAELLHDAPTLTMRVTSTDSEGVLDALVAHYARGEGPPLPARRHGSGLVSLQTLLLLLQFGSRRAALGESFWMAMEEPELHLPPPLQRRMVSRLQSLSGQTFISSHSPTVAAMSDPETVFVLHNKGGELSATHLVTAKSRQEDVNPVRQLFELYRLETISALMHEAVLIPEGATDFLVLQLLAAAVDSARSWRSRDACHFASEIGVIRTKDAAVEATYRRLQELHPRLVCLVDGDKPGRGYAKALMQLDHPPAKVLRWPDAWTIESILGWIVKAAPELLNNLDVMPPLSSVEELVCRLQTDDRSKGGLKQDPVFYELLAQGIAQAKPARDRARTLLNSLAEESRGNTSSLFADDGKPSSERVFQP
jgi:putative ATP-dependent endonuclease of the OLD family